MSLPKSELEAFLQRLPQADFQFEETLAFIENHYDFTASSFNNGSVENAVDENQGSCKVFALAELLNLSQEQTLQCFGQHYRDVLATPDVSNHHNLRRVQREGLGDIHFAQFPLAEKTV